jgi:hypothetical protein
MPNRAVIDFDIVRQIARVVPLRTVNKRLTDASEHLEARLPSREKLGVRLPIPIDQRTSLPKANGDTNVGESLWRLRERQQMLAPALIPRLPRLCSRSDNAGVCCIPRCRTSRLLPSDFNRCLAKQLPLRSFRSLPMRHSATCCANTNGRPI